MSKAPDRIEIKCPHLLLVEGTTDKAFFDEMVKRLGLAEKVQVMYTGGKNQLRPVLKQLKDAPDFEIVTSLGIIRDADDNSNGAFQSARDALKAAGLPFPAQAEQLSDASDDNPSTAIMILPDAAQTGMLEDLCMRAFRGDEVEPCVDQYFDCLPTKPKPAKLAKARTQVFLAAKDDDDFRLEVAVKKAWFPWEHPAFDGVKQFVRMLPPAKYKK